MLEDEMNRLRTPGVDVPTPVCGQGGPRYFLTFTNDTQLVNVSELQGCGFVTNGVLFANTSTPLNKELDGFRMKFPTSS